MSHSSLGRPKLTLIASASRVAGTRFPKTARSDVSRALYFLEIHGITAWSMESVPLKYLARKSWCPEENPHDGAPQIFAVLRKRFPGRLLAITVPTMERSKRWGRRFERLFNWYHDLEADGAVMLTMWRLEDLEQKLEELGEFEGEDDPACPWDEG